MTAIRVQTAFGEIAFAGTVPGVSSGPMVVVLRGAFAPADQMAALPALLPGVDVVFGEVPGHRSPKLVADSVGVYAAAYTQALQQIGRRVVVCGVSLGGIVALAMRSPLVMGTIALDPPLRTADAPHIVRAMAGFDAPGFLWSVFGVAPDGRREPRDYLPALDGLTAPATVLAGSPAPRQDGRLPGAIAEETFGQVARAPLVTARRINNCGHDLGHGASDLIVERLSLALGADAVQ